MLVCIRDMMYWKHRFAAILTNIYNSMQQWEKNQAKSKRGFPQNTWSFKAESESSKQSLTVKVNHNQKERKNKKRKNKKSLKNCQ